MVPAKALLFLSHPLTQINDDRGRSNFETMNDIFRTARGHSLEKSGSNSAG